MGELHGGICSNGLWYGSPAWFYFVVCVLWVLQVVDGHFGALSNKLVELNTFGTYRCDENHISSYKQFHATLWASLLRRELATPDSVLAPPTSHLSCIAGSVLASLMLTRLLNANTPCGSSTLVPLRSSSSSVKLRSRLS